MDRGLVVGLGVLGAVGVGLIALNRNGGGGDSSSSPPPSALSPDLGGLGAGLGGIDGGGLVYDPVTGAYYDAGSAPGVGPDGLPLDSSALGPTFSPEFEAAALEEARRFNKATEDEERRANDAYNDHARDAAKWSQAADLATIGLFALPVAGPALARVGGALARTGANVVRGGAGAAARTGSAALNATRTARLGNIAPRSAALLRTPTAVFGSAAAAGVAAGVGVTAVLEKTGALDALDRTDFTKKAIHAVTPKRFEAEAEVAVKSAALPVAATGAVVAGLAGRGSVRDNLRKTYRGTVQQRVVTATTDAAKDASSAVASTASKTYKAGRSFVRGLF